MAAGPWIQFPVGGLGRPERHVQAALVLDEHPFGLTLIGDVLHRSLRQEIAAGSVIDVLRHFEEGADLAIRAEDAIFHRIAGIECGECLRHPLPIRGMDEAIEVGAV